MLLSTGKDILGSLETSTGSGCLAFISKIVESVSPKGALVVVVVVVVGGTVTGGRVV